jgi:hypothetical protein
MNWVIAEDRGFSERDEAHERRTRERQGDFSMTPPIPRSTAPIHTPEQQAALDRALAIIDKQFKTAKRQVPWVAKRKSTPSHSKTKPAVAQVREQKVTTPWVVKPKTT